MLLGVAAVAAVGYYLYTTNRKKSTAGFLRRGGRIQSLGLESAGMIPVKGCKKYQKDEATGGAKFVMVGNTAYYPCCNADYQATQPPSSSSQIGC